MIALSSSVVSKVSVGLSSKRDKYKDVLTMHCMVVPKVVIKISKPIINTVITIVISVCKKGSKLFNPNNSKMITPNSKQIIKFTLTTRCQDEPSFDFANPIASLGPLFSNTIIGSAK